MKENSFESVQSDISDEENKENKFYNKKNNDSLILDSKKEKILENRKSNIIKSK